MSLSFLGGGSQKPVLSWQANTWTATQTFAAIGCTTLTVTPSSGNAPGTIYGNTAHGFAIQARAGSVSDFSILRADGSAYLITNPTGTSNIAFAAGVSCASLTSTGKITTVSAVPGSFADLAAVRTWLAAQFT